MSSDELDSMQWMLHKKIYICTSVSYLTEGYILAVRVKWYIYKVDTHVAWNMKNHLHIPPTFVPVIIIEHFPQLLPETSFLKNVSILSSHYLSFGNFVSDTNVCMHESVIYTTMLHM